MALSPDDERGTRRTDRKTLLQRVTLAVAAVFVVVGVLGFIPGVTSDFDQLQFASHDSEAKLFGIFQVSVLHNIVHLLFGIVGFMMSRTFSIAKLYLVGGGAIYIVLWIYGLIIDKDSAANFVPLNTADDWLHFVLGVGMVGLGLLLGRRDGQGPA